MQVEVYAGREEKRAPPPASTRPPSRVYGLFHTLFSCESSSHDGSTPSLNQLQYHLELHLNGKLAACQLLEHGWLAVIRFVLTLQLTHSIVHEC